MIIGGSVVESGLLWCCAVGKNWWRRVDAPQHDYLLRRRESEVVFRTSVLVLVLWCIEANMCGAYGSGESM
jgi:hypothetical protein